MLSNSPTLFNWLSSFLLVSEMFGLRLSKIVPDDFVEGVQFRTRHKRAATRAALLCLVEAGTIQYRAQGIEPARFRNGCNSNLCPNLCLRGRDARTFPARAMPADTCGSRVGIALHVAGKSPDTVAGSKPTHCTGAGEFRDARDSGVPMHPAQLRRDGGANQRR